MTTLSTNGEVALALAKTFSASSYFKKHTLSCSPISPHQNYKGFIFELFDEEAA